MTASEVPGRREFGLQLPSITRRPTSREPTYREEAPEGYVYIITNPAWPGYVKIGCAGDCKKRLAQFNTGSPSRDYEMVHHVYNGNRRKAESRVHEMFHPERALGEWFKATVAEVADAMEEVSEYDSRAFNA
jgi:hypothetical protein